MKKIKPIPKFKNEDDERDFWATHDTTEYFDMNNMIVNPSLPNLKFSTKTITIRVPESLLDDLKTLANKMDIPYQSLMKKLLIDKVKEEFASYKIK